MDNPRHWFAVETAGTGILGCNEHEISWKSDGAGSAGDTYFPGIAFHWLAQHFDHPLAKLGQFIQKQNPSMGQRDLTRPRPGATANQASVTDGMVGGSKRPEPDQGGIGRQQIGNTVDFGNLQRFVHRHSGQYPGERFGDEGFTSAGRTRKKCIMPTCGRDFHSALDMLLALDIGKISLVGMNQIKRLFYID